MRIADREPAASSLPGAAACPRLTRPVTTPSSRPWTRPEHAPSRHTGHIPVKNFDPEISDPDKLPQLNDAGQRFGFTDQSSCRYLFHCTLGELGYLQEGATLGVLVPRDVRPSWSLSYAE
jgi:hypothetical protein